MSSDQWRRIEDLFHAASQLHPSDQLDYLKRESGNDPAIVAEVQSLIEASNDALFETPAVSLGLKVLSNASKPGALAGRTIGHFKIIKLLGAGGMGEVYLATDLNLQRQVALKFLNHGFGNDEWLRAQLILEARAVAQLENHNICSIHGLENEDGQDFIEMQYVEGETLQTRLSSGPLSIDLALDFAEQVAGALSAAHEHGIVHRDVKTQNIIVTPDDQIKVLDFGLAKLVKPIEPTQSKSEQHQTGASGILGTVAYMSPEQAEGDEIDARSDIFSFGIVFYEMLTGENPFRRDDKFQTLEAIKNEHPDLSLDLPKQLLNILGGCLEKDRDNRFKSSKVLRSEIQALRRSREPSPFTTWMQSRNFKYLAAAAAVLLVFILASSAFVYHKTSSVHSIALLQIQNRSGDANLDYLSQGLTRSLFDKFSYLTRLQVKAPSTMPFDREQNVDLKRAGRDLSVESVLSGEILKHDQSLLLRLSLSDTENGGTKWQEEFNLDAANMFVLQDDITRKVVSSLGLWLIGGERKRLNKHQTDNDEALRKYMLGRQFSGLKRSRENMQKAIGYFEQAIELDPSFAEAYSGLSDCYAVMNNVANGPIAPSVAMAKARWSAQQALDLDDSLPEAHTSLGIINLRFDWNWEKAESEFKRAIELKPVYAPAHYWYSNLLSALGRHDEAIRESKTSRDLDPYSLLAEMNYGRSLYYARRYAEAEDYFADLLSQNDQYPSFQHMMALVQLQLGRYQPAIELLEQMRKNDPLYGTAALGYAYGKNGQRNEAQNILRALDEASTREPVPPHEKAIVYLGLGDKDQAFKYLDQSLEERFASMAFLNADPLYDDIRSDVRFRELEQKVGLSLP
ncbi:MAG TPA: protein kinase [Pyrinomonadaceae bacterium]|nr:protein kinase [Pyrinomonadaceae bacterium]